MPSGATADLVYRFAAAEYTLAESRCHEEIDDFKLTQRDLTHWAFAVISSARPDVQEFVARLVQTMSTSGEPQQVVPDNFVVLHPEPIAAVGSFNTPLQPVGPFLVMEYVSKHNKRKDYEDNFVKYETELRVPYYLLFYPGNQELTLFRMAGGRYVSVPPNAAGRFAVPELELEAGLVDGWVRFWFRGQLTPLPADLLRERDAERQARLAAEAEIARLRAELANRPG